MHMNRLILIDVCPKTGLLNYPRCEHTSAPVTQVASAAVRGQHTIARIVAAKIVDGNLSGRVWDYLTESETRQCKIAHAVRTADNSSATGRMTLHVAGNLRSFVRSRDLNAQGIMMMHQVSDGWWMRAGSTVWLWTELGAITRALEKATQTPEGSIESPFYDPTGVEA